MNSAPAKAQNPKQENITNTHKNLSIYYSHPIKTYNTDREKRAIAMLKKRFPNGTIVNPKKYHLSGMKGYLQLEAQCSIFAYHRALNRHITKGVALERLLAFMIGMPIYKIGSKITKENISVISYPEGLLSDHDYTLASEITTSSEGLK